MAETAAEVRDMDKQAARQLPSYSSIAKSLIAGGIAGGVSRTAVAPLERLKILQQVQDPKNPKYTGVWQGLRRMMAEGGIRDMMKGNGTNCVRIVPNSAVKFFTYEQLSHAILFRMKQDDPDARLTPVMRLTAGAGAGIIAMSATYPLDMVRGRLTVGSSEYNGIVHAARTIVAKEGAGALYKGWLPSVLGVIPYVGFNFAVYETLKDVLIQKYEVRDERDLGVMSRLACGAVAGSFGQTVAYPLDVVRRRLQMTGDCFIKTVRNEGPTALFRGLAPNYLKVCPTIAIAFVTYEQVKELLGVEFRISD